MKILLTRDEVSNVLRDVFDDDPDQEVRNVRITPTGDHLAEITIVERAEDGDESPDAIKVGGTSD